MILFDIDHATDTEYEASEKTMLAEAMALAREQLGPQARFCGYVFWSPNENAFLRRIVAVSAMGMVVKLCVVPDGAWRIINFKRAVLHYADLRDDYELQLLFENDEGYMSVHSGLEMSSDSLHRIH